MRQCQKQPQANRVLVQTEAATRCVEVGVPLPWGVNIAPLESPRRQPGSNEDFLVTDGDSASFPDHQLYRIKTESSQLAVVRPWTQGVKQSQTQVMPKRGQNPTEESSPKQKRRATTVYDVVAGNVGINGFLSAEQKASNATKPLAPEEVLLKHGDNTNASADQQSLHDDDKTRVSLPASDLLKAIHEYAAFFYDMATPDHGKHDIRSMDGSALVAAGCLLEEASRQLLGGNGDMVLVEPRSRGRGIRETQLATHQVVGRVNPSATPEPDTEVSSTDDEQEPAKKRRV